MQNLKMHKILLSRQAYRTNLLQYRLKFSRHLPFPDEFMAAIKLRWPTALVQFEDFQSKHAIKLLMRYKKEYLMFNDDIQVGIVYHPV